MGAQAGRAAERPLSRLCGAWLWPFGERDWCWGKRRTLGLAAFGPRMDLRLEGCGEDRSFTVAARMRAWRGEINRRPADSLAVKQESPPERRADTQLSGASEMSFGPTRVSVSLLRCRFLWPHRLAPNTAAPRVAPLAVSGPTKVLLTPDVACGSKLFALLKALASPQVVDFAW